jgi:hypothetical protein
MYLFLSYSGGSDHLLESFDEYDMSETDRKRDRILDISSSNNSNSNSSSGSSSVGCRSPKGSGDRSKATVLLKLLGPLGNMRIRSIRKTVWFWGILLGT